MYLDKYMWIGMDQMVEPGHLSMDPGGSREYPDGSTWNRTCSMLYGTLSNWLQAVASWIIMGANGTWRFSMDPGGSRQYVDGSRWYLHGPINVFQVVLDIVRLAPGIVASWISMSPNGTWTFSMGPGGSRVSRWLQVVSTWTCSMLYWTFP